MTSTPKVYLDTNVFIAAFEHTTARSDHARWVFEAVEDGRIAAGTSELTLAELLVRPLQEGAADIASAYDAMIRPGPGFDTKPVDRDVLREAARVRAGRLSIRFPDAIHVASARQLGCGILVTDDGGLTTSQGPLVIKLGPHTLDDIRRSAS